MHCRKLSISAMTEKRRSQTTMTRDGAIADPGVDHITDESPEVTAEENEVPQIWLQAQPAFRHHGYWAVREELKAAQKARGFFGRAGTEYEALEYSTAETAHEVCKMSQTWTLGSRASRRASGTLHRR